MQGEALAGSFRWERDVVRLEKVKLEQRRSTYEVNAQLHTLPSYAKLAWQNSEQLQQQHARYQISSDL